MRAAQSTEDLKSKADQTGQELKVKAGETGEVFKSNVAQLLGVRGGEQTADKWKIRLQLTKPVTWVPLIWGAQKTRRFVQILSEGAWSTDSLVACNLPDLEIPMVAGVLCGAAASGNFTWTPEHVAQSLVCMTMSGPFLTGYTQTINDYYDREIDAINEPNRPIPSGVFDQSQLVQVPNKCRSHRLFW